jgi:hypothetical protein
MSCCYQACPELDALLPLLQDLAAARSLDEVRGAHRRLLAALRHQCGVPTPGARPGIWAHLGAAVRDALDHTLRFCAALGRDGSSGSVSAHVL